MKKLNLELNGEKVIAIFPRGPGTVLMVTPTTHFLIEKSREEVWRVTADGNTNAKEKR